MRRIIIATVAVALLVAAGAAYAAGATLDTFTGTSLAFTPGTAGSSSAPVPTGFTQTLEVQSAQSGLRAAPLTDIKLTIYGLKVDTKDFATCSPATIDKKPLYDSACNPKAMVASGSIRAQLGSSNLQGAGTPCTPILHVWNSGGGKVTFFFISKNATVCGGVLTGKTAPYVGTIKQVGPNLVQDTPLPADVSTEAANLPGVYGSLIYEHLVWSKLTTRVAGKTVALVSSVGCKAGKRPYTVAYSFTNGTVRQTASVTGSPSC